MSVPESESESAEHRPKLLGRDGHLYSIAELHCLAVEFSIIDVIKTALSQEKRTTKPDKRIYIGPLLQHCAQNPHLSAADRTAILRKHAPVRPTRVITKVRVDQDKDETYFTYDIVYPPELEAVLHKHGLEMDKMARIGMYKGVPPYNPYCYQSLQDLCYLDRAAEACTSGPGGGMLQMPAVCAVCVDRDLEGFVPESDL